MLFRSHHSHVLAELVPPQIGRYKVAHIKRDVTSGGVGSGLMCITMLNPAQWGV